MDLWENFLRKESTSDCDFSRNARFRRYIWTNSKKYSDEVHFLLEKVDPNRVFFDIGHI